MDRRPNVAATMDGGSCVKTQHYVFERGLRQTPTPRLCEEAKPTKQSSFFDD